MIDRRAFISFAVPDGCSSSPPLRTRHVIQRILAHLGLPGTRDGPQPPCSMTEVGAKQPALPSVTF